MPTPAQLDAEITQLENRIARLRADRDSQRQDSAAAILQRPAGVPATWKPYFTGTGHGLRIHAWYDPQQFGDGPLNPGVLIPS